MLGILFESHERARRDEIELQNLQTSFGADLVPELRKRAIDTTLSPRHRKHWKRLLRKAKRIAS